MKTLAIASVVALGLFLTACPPKDPPPRGTPWTVGCPLERLDWMNVREGYDRATVVELAGKIEAAAQADAEQIRQLGAAEVRAEFSSSLRSVIEQSSGAQVDVSQRFYEQYVTSRLAICSIYQGIQDGIYTDADARRQAQNAFTRIAVSFAEVREETTRVRSAEVSFSVKTDEHWALQMEFTGTAHVNPREISFDIARGQISYPKATPSGAESITVQYVRVGLAEHYQGAFREIGQSQRFEIHQSLMVGEGMELPAFRLSMPIVGIPSIVGNWLVFTAVTDVPGSPDSVAFVYAHSRPDIF